MCGAYYTPCAKDDLLIMRATEKIDKAGAASLRFLYNTAVGRILLFPLICRPVSFIAGKFLDSRLSKIFVKRFIKSNGIDMTDYEDRAFNSFNDFFTRRVKESARPVCTEENAFISPCDARLTVYPITQERCFEVKGVNYTVKDLLCSEQLAQKFEGGYCMIFRLAVDNYHRYGWCADGKAEKTVKIKGKYHTVQPIAVRKYPVFRENVREYTVLENELFGICVQLEVGALMVGRICNDNPFGGTAKRGAEKGRFEFGGSTVIVLTQKDKVSLDDEFFQNTQNGLETLVKYGEGLGYSNN